MHPLRKIFLGVITLAIPATSFAVFGGPSLFAGAVTPSYPVACRLAATVTFSPQLTKTGVDTTNKLATTNTSISGGTLTDCLSADPAHGAPTSGSFTATIKTPAVKAAKVGKVQHYTIGSCPAFASTNTLKSLKGLVLVIHWSGGAGGTSTFTVKSPSPAISSLGEVGFVFAGKAVVGSYSEKPLNQITAYLAQAQSTALATGCSGNQIVGSTTVDPTRSVAIL